MKKKAFLITGSYHAPLSVRIQAEYNKLATLISDVPDSCRSMKDIEGTGGKVNISDIIAYQIGWGNLLLNWYEAGLKAKIPQMPGEGFSKWDYKGLAKHFYEKYHYDNPIKQDLAFYDVVNKIVAITEHEYKSNNLDKKGVWSWCTLSSGKQWPLSKWITIN